MKNNKFFFFATFFALCLLISCSDDDKDINKNRLPQTAQSLISACFPEYTIKDIEQVDDKGDEMNEKYVVLLSGKGTDITTSFSSLGFWRRIESKTALPESAFNVLPGGTADKIKAKYPERSVHSIHFVAYGNCITLDDGTRLAQYDTTTGKEPGLDLSKNVFQWPETIREFLIKHYTQPGVGIMTHTFIQENEQDGGGYRFWKANGSEVYFDKDGNWYYVNGGDWRIPTGIYAMLPEDSRNIIEDKYKGLEVRKLIRHNDYYQVYVRHNVERIEKWLQFDSQTGEEIDAPTDAVNAFLKEYVGDLSPETTLSYDINFNVNKVIYKFEGKKDGTDVLKIYTDIDGHIIYLDLYKKPLPATVLDYLPAKMKAYMLEHYKGKGMVKLWNGLDGEYAIWVVGDMLVEFDSEGNYIKTSIFCF